VRPSISNSATPGITLVLPPARITVGDAVLARSAPRLRATPESGRRRSDARHHLGLVKSLSSGRATAGWRAATAGEELRMYAVGWTGKRALPRAADRLAIRTTALSGRGIEPWPGSPRHARAHPAQPFSATWTG
jgi:hypothetical protein